MTNEQALILNNVCSFLESEYFKSDSKFEIPKSLFYAVSRNIGRTKKAVKEKEELDTTVMKDFKKDFGFDDEKAKDEKYVEEANVKFAEYKQKDEIKEQYETFLKDEFKSVNDISKVKVEVFEDAILPNAYREILEELIVE
jgi:uncharacterized protein (DUF1697 family)